MNPRPLRGLGSIIFQEWILTRTFSYTWKPTICIGENKDADQHRSNREADQRLCFRYSDSTIPVLLILLRNFKLLALSCACTGWFVSDLFGNHIVGFPTRWLKYSAICYFLPFSGFTNASYSLSNMPLSDISDDDTEKYSRK